MLFLLHCAFLVFGRSEVLFVLEELFGKFFRWFVKCSLKHFLMFPDGSLESCLEGSSGVQGSGWTMLP